ncbi:10385_t:CDS:2, partial [Paraglomus occultum]
MSANIQIEQTTSTYSPITCHVLDSSCGRPASGIRVQLELKSPPETNNKTEDTWGFIAEGETNNDGRIPNLINPDLLPPDWKKSLKLFDYGDGPPAKAIFRITFYTKEYFDKLKQKTFYPYVQ